MLPLVPCYEITISSVHWIISLSLCSISYNGVCFKRLKLSVSDAIVSQKGSNGDGKLHFFRRDYNFTCSLCAKILLWASVRYDGTKC